MKWFSQISQSFWWRHGICKYWGWLAQFILLSFKYLILCLNSFIFNNDKLLLIWLFLLLRQLSHTPCHYWASLFLLMIWFCSLCSSRFFLRFLFFLAKLFFRNRFFSFKFEFKRFFSLMWFIRIFRRHWKFGDKLQLASGLWLCCIRALFIFRFVLLLIIWTHGNWWKLLTIMLWNTG